MACEVPTFFQPTFCNMPAKYLKMKIILHRPNNNRTRLTFADTYVFQMSLT